MPLPLLYISSTVCPYPHNISHLLLTNSLSLHPTTLNFECSVAYVIRGFVLILNINLTLVPLLVFFLVTLQHKVFILSILVIIQFPQQIDLPTLLPNRLHEATSKNYRSRLASPPELHLEGAYQRIHYNRISFCFQILVISCNFLFFL